MAALDLLSYISLGHKLAILVVYYPSLEGEDRSAPVQHGTRVRQRTIYYKRARRASSRNGRLAYNARYWGVQGWIDEEYKLETEKARA